MSCREVLLQKINEKQELEAKLKEQMEILRTVNINLQAINDELIQSPCNSEQCGYEGSPGRCRGLS